MATAIFYASNTGNTQDIAELISKELSDIEIFDISDSGLNKIKEYDKLIFGISTWGEGELQDDWDDVIEDFAKIDFTGTTVAIFGLGDQDGYGDYFVDAMYEIYENVTNNGANVIGSFDIDDDYCYNESKSVIDNKFLGLSIDQDNQYDLSNARINKWCNEIRNEIL